MKEPILLSLACLVVSPGEERQVHYGENFVDPPNFARGAFKAATWLDNASSDELARHVDLPSASPICITSPSWPWCWNDPDVLIYHPSVAVWG